MNFSINILKRSIFACSNIMKPILSRAPVACVPCSPISSIVNTMQSTNVSRNDILKPNVFLVPVSFSIVPSNGMKIKGVLKRRCKDCYKVAREGKLYMMCRSFPKHKQQLMMPKERRTWILSHCMQSKLRPY